MNVGIRVIEGGLSTTVQDEGRRGYQKYGFSSSGAMDRKSFRIANLLVGNPQEASVLEMILVGGSFVFTESTVIALTGGNCQPKINGQPIKMYQALQVRKGDQLTTGTVTDGVFAYIAFAGGLNVPEVMGSTSTSTRYGLGGYQGRRLQEGDILEFHHSVTDLKALEKRYLPELAEKKQAKLLTIRLVLGPHADFFPDAAKEIFFTSSYSVSAQADRMGYRLNGAEVKAAHHQDLLSEGTVLGDVQVPPDGKPIVLLADRQTTGGYPVIGTVCSIDLPKLVQRPQGLPFQFAPISVKEAQRLLAEQEAAFSEMEEAFREPAKAKLSQLAPLPKSMTPTTNGDTQVWETARIAELIQLFDSSALASFSYKDADGRVEMKKQPSMPNFNSDSSFTATESASTLLPSVEVIRSPLVGIFYTDSGPNKTPFIQEGDQVSRGQTIGVVETMRIRNDIKAVQSGVVRKILVKNGYSVEYGQPLVEVELVE